MNIDRLISSIQGVDTSIKIETGKAINRLLTCRNWLIGRYIFEHEQHGEDRAMYGEKLIDTIADKLDSKSLSKTNLKYFRQFFRVYPQISQILIKYLPPSLEIGQSLIGELTSTKTGQSLIGQLTTVNNEDNKLIIPPEKLIERLSFTHLLQLLPIQDDLKRTFYELECIKGNWSVRELKRQINSLYFERSAISKKPELLSEMVRSGAEVITPEQIIKDVYTFEFLGLPIKDAVEENKLESALLDHLQEFIIELGRGFCFEARQQRILIGDEYFFIDLVFYHRILKCHILIELKVEEFSHTNAGQLNTYLNYYKSEVMQKTDNPPVGILLVTNKNEALVQYATAGMDQQMFVKQYQLMLPAKEELEFFIKQELRNVI